MRSLKGLTTVASLTSNYGWTKPVVGGDGDLWGSELNTDLDQIDSTVKSVSNAIPVASSAAPLMDGTATVGVATTWARADHVHPVDTSRYAASNPSGYQTAAQVTAVVPVASTNAPLMNAATAVAGSSAAWSPGDHVHPIDTSRYAASNPSGYQTAAQVTTSLGPYALTANVPVASSTTPNMDGTAAVGTGTTFARADHIHPSDTSRAPIASPTFTGAPSMPTGSTGITQTAGNNSTALATTAYIDRLPVAMNDNRIINGDFAINQRGQVSGTALAAAAYGHDRWKAGASGCTYTFTAALPDTTITITAGTLTQIIEAGAIESGVHTLSWAGTAQARVYQGTPTGSYAASPVITASLTAGTNTIVEFNTGTLVRVKFEIGSIATVFNRQSLAKSLVDCQRYYEIGFGYLEGYAGTAGEYLAATISFNTTKRAVPTLTVNYRTANNITTANSSVWASATYNQVGSFVYEPQATAVGAASSQITWTASAEL